MMPSVKAILSRLGLGGLALQSTAPQQEPLQSFSFNAADSPSLLPSESTLPAPSCPLNGPLSCHNTTAAKDDCCFVYPGGQLMLTQFWDTRPSIGPNDSWTLHGLWYVMFKIYSDYCSLYVHYVSLLSAKHQAL